MSDDDNKLRDKLLLGGALVAGACVVAWALKRWVFTDAAVYNAVQGLNAFTAELIFNEAFPDGRDQPIPVVKRLLLRKAETIPNIDVRSIDFWLFLGDLNNDGLISRDEFKMMVKTGTFSNKLNLGLWEADLRTLIFRVFDVDKDGFVSLTEFTDGLRRLNASLPPAERYRDSDAAEARKAFKELDKDGSEDLSVEEWAQCTLAKGLIQQNKIHPLWRDTAPASK